MKYKNDDINQAFKKLDKEFEAIKHKRSILRSAIFKELYANIKSIDAQSRAEYGQEVNKLKQHYEKLIEDSENKISDDVSAIDITAPFDANVKPENRPKLLPVTNGTKHPLMEELDRFKDIFTRMGFRVEDSRQLDSDYNMFGALNFPEDHPARDDYDTFMTNEGLIPPAHTSTMQNRILKKYEPPIRAVIPGRVYRNEDVDATHEHTFYQIEGVYVDKGITVKDMIGTIIAFLEEYFEQDIEYKTQPFFFPFVEPGLEFLIKMPESLKKPGQAGDQWLEIMGCGMIHPNVLKEGGVDPEKYTGFAFGMGVDRMVMLRHGIEDVRHYHSGKLEFMRRFK